MSAEDNAKLARTYYEVFNSREFERGVALMAEGVEVVNVPLGVTLQRPEGYRQFVQGWATAFPDSQVEIINMIAGETGVSTEFRGRGTHTGPLIGPMGEIPATGRQIDIPFCDVVQIKDGKVVSIHLYYDVATMMRQLGLLS